jgi:hypothetical protein
MADVHMVISYCLRHTEEVNECLAARRQEATKLRAQVEVDPKTQIIRRRLLEQRARSLKLLLFLLLLPRGLRRV